MARMFRIDRQTVREKLRRAGLEPVAHEVGKEKLYVLEDAEPILRKDELEEARLEKTRAEAELKGHQLKIAKGEFASVAEFTEVTQEIFKRLYSRIAVQLPGRLATRLHNANNSSEVAQILKNALNKEFTDLRTDFPRYLGRA